MTYLVVINYTAKRPERPRSLGGKAITHRASVHSTGKLVCQVNSIRHLYDRARQEIRMLHSTDGLCANGVAYTLTTTEVWGLGGDSRNALSTPASAIGSIRRAWTSWPIREPVLGYRPASPFTILPSLWVDCIELWIGHAEKLGSLRDLYVHRRV
jgi:hypothetical protein